MQGIIEEAGPIFAITESQWPSDSRFLLAQCSFSRIFPHHAVNGNIRRHAGNFAETVSKIIQAFLKDPRIPLRHKEAVSFFMSSRQPAVISF
jgi:hypothetical protein